MGLLDTLFSQLQSFRVLGNTNPENFPRVEPAAVYAADGEDSPSDSNVESPSDSDVDSDGSEDLEAKGGLFGQSPAVIQGYFTEEELTALTKKLKSRTNSTSSVAATEFERALDPYVRKASRIFRNYGGRTFVRGRFLPLLLSNSSNSSESSEFNSFRQEALGLAQPAATPQGSSVSVSSSSTGQIISLPLTWSTMTKWQKYAWLVSKQIDSSYVLERKRLEKKFAAELEGVQQRMAEARATVEVQWQVASGKKASKGRAKGDLVSKFRPNMEWSHANQSTIRNFRLVGMFYDPANPQEVLFEHTMKGAGGSPTVWTGTLDRTVTLPSDRRQQQYGSERITFDAYASYSPERPFPVSFESHGGISEMAPYVFASDRNFHSQLRFNIGDRYFCPEWGDGGATREDIVGFEMYTVVRVEESSYVVFKKDDENTEVSALIQVCFGEDSDVTLNPQGRFVKIEYAMLDIDDVDEQNRTIYATYTPNVKISVEEYQEHQEDRRRRREVVEGRNAARALGGLSSSSSTSDGDGTSSDGASSSDDANGGLGSGDDDVAAASSASVLMAEDKKWWRVDTTNAKIDDRIEVGTTAPARPPKNLQDQVMRRKKPWKWLQWDSAAITFAGVAESDSSGLATETAKRNPLSFEDCQQLANKVPDAKLQEIVIGGDRKACVVYLPKFFDTGGVNQADMVQEMQRVKPQYIDRHTQNRGPTQTNHKNKRWNTNIVDKIHARPDGVYKRDKRRVEAAKAKFAKTAVKEDKYIPKLTSSEIPFAQLPAFTKAREKIAALGKSVLPEEPRAPYGTQKENLTNLNCELNFYFGNPLPAGGIGFHGDEERNLVFGGSIGSKPRYIEWCRFFNAKPYKDPEDNKFDVYRMKLNPGDAYIMSEWAAGITWKDRKNVTIRHRAGSRAFLYKDAASKVKVDGGRSVFTRNYDTDEDANNFRTIDITGMPAAPPAGSSSFTIPAAGESSDSETESEIDEDLPNISLAFEGGELNNEPAGNYPIAEESRLNNLGVAASGSRQREAYYNKRTANSSRPLSRFRVWETIKGKGRKNFEARLIITGRGTKDASSDEYLNVDVEDHTGKLLGKYQYKIRMNTTGYPYFGTNAKYAFEVATLEGGKNNSCPNRISSWTQTCPLGYETGVTYFPRTSSQTWSFEVGSRLLYSDNVQISAQTQTSAEGGESPLPDSGGSVGLHVVLQRSEDSELCWEELRIPDPLDRLDDHPLAAYALGLPLCKEEYSATQRRAERRAGRNAAAGAAAVPRTSSEKLTKDEFVYYKDLVLRESSDSDSNSDSNSAELRRFRARVTKLLGGNANVQLVLEPNFADEEDEDYLYYLKIILSEEAFAATAQALQPLRVNAAPAPAPAPAPALPKFDPNMGAKKAKGLQRNGFTVKLLEGYDVIPTTTELDGKEVWCGELSSIGADPQLLFFDPDDEFCNADRGDCHALVDHLRSIGVNAAQELLKKGIQKWLAYMTGPKVGRTLENLEIGDYLRLRFMHQTVGWLLNDEDMNVKNALFAKTHEVFQARHRELKDVRDDPDGED